MFLEIDLAEEHLRWPRLLWAKITHKYDTFELTSLY